MKENISSLESKAQLFINRFQESGEEIYIFGAGMIGRDIENIMSVYGCVAGFIDNDLNKQKSGYLGYKVYSLEEYLELKKSGYILIAVSSEKILAIKEQLVEAGLMLGRDYYIKEVFPLISYFYYNKIFMELCQISLTERCTLKCEKCAHACYNVSRNARDMPIDEAKESADMLFGKVDVIGEFTLIGGEPFLYRNIAEIIDYIGSRYLKKIGVFSITTNGTLFPTEEVLELCRKYNILIRISNYSGAIPYLTQKYNALLELLKKYGIQYVLGAQEHEWMDYGFGVFDRGTEADLNMVFQQCRTNCREVRTGKLYYCVMARSVSDNLKLKIGKDDYLDLRTIKPDNRDDLFLFQMGYFEKGYLDMCRYCRGSEAALYPIPAAVQKRNSN